MSQNRVLWAMSLGAASLAGSLALGAQSAQATTTGTVTYQGGATTVWRAPAFKQVNRYLLHGQRINIIGSTKINGYTWYQIGANEWVPDLYLRVNGAASVVQQTSTSVQQSSAAPAQTVQGQIKVTYAVGATTVWQSPNSRRPVKYLSTGEVVSYTASKQVGGLIWYAVDGGWVPGQYVSTNIAAATVQPKVPTNQPTASVQRTQAPQNQTTITTSTPASTSTAVEKQQTQAAQPAQAPAGNTQEDTNSTATHVSTTPATSNNQTPQQNTTTTTASTTTPATATPTANANTSTSGNYVPPTGNRYAQIQAVISLAKQQLGKPYVWGAHGPSSFDCSGLMQYVFANAVGRQIGWWTVPQESAGMQVSLNALQPGDLLFWGQHGNSYHVALYLGNNQYLNAPEPGDVVKIQSISPYFAPSFAVRVL
ncbi:MAG: NlpC/P60 family protein [Schleiferilactobacillus harbinensis]|jgi:cell wall-associated NlpC family hydrolase|nr:NlpC/P60 family protein [Schleiferilactobacillus harbinensis]MCI1912842.1 NlpC/P60 family protein [Schleiferilactobacillus harbinensis]